jgi:hypothetical protein
MTDLTDEELCALHLTFAERGTQALPVSWSAPPEDWQTSIRALDVECGIETDIAADFENVHAFFEDVLTGKIEE